MPLLTPLPCFPAPPDQCLPKVRIVEQPAQSVRFRYESEGRIEVIFGRSSVKCKRKTYPTLEIYGYEGEATITISLVTAQKPYLQHPHKLYGNEENTNGIYEFNVQLKKENARIVVPNLGIQHTLQRDVVKELMARKKTGVDPFQTGFKHINDPKNINLKAVRLCFLVSIYDKRTGEKTNLAPVVSNVIYDGKALMNLTIRELSITSDYHFGGRRLIILCGWVTNDISVVFFEKVEDKIVWEKHAKVDYVHNHVAIACFVPRYHSNRDAEVGVELRMSLKTEEGERNNVMSFNYMAKLSDSEVIKEKENKKLSPHLLSLERILRETINQPSGSPQDSEPIAGPSGATLNTHNMLPPWLPYIKPVHINNHDLFSNGSVLSVRNMPSNDYASNMHSVDGHVHQRHNTYSDMQISGNVDTSMQSIACGEDFFPEYLRNTDPQQQALPELALPEFGVFFDRVGEHHT
ncbi:unnamed protein product, partial [Brenthis ino]